MLGARATTTVFMILPARSNLYSEEQSAAQRLRTASNYNYSWSDVQVAINAAGGYVTIPNMTVTLTLSAR